MAKAKGMLFLVMFWLLMVSASGTGACSPANGADPNEVVRKAYQKFLDVKSYHMTMGVTTSMTVFGNNLNVVMNGESDVQVKPMLMKSIMTVKMNMGQNQSEQTILQYAEQAGDQFVVYSNAKNQWVKQSVPMVNPMNEYDNYFKGITSVTPVRETADATVYEVTVSGSYLRENIERAMASAGAKNMKLPMEIFNNLGDFKYTLFIDKKTAMISEMVIDLSDFIKTIGANIAEMPNVPEGQKKMLKEMFGNARMVTTVSFSQINGVGKIQIPQEAKNAVDAVGPSVKPADSLLNTNSGQQKVVGGPPIKIGVNLELSGGVAAFGQDALNGAQLAVKEANLSGGVLGRQVELVIQDNASDPNKAIGAMTALTSQDKVVAIIGPVASSYALAAAPVAKASRVLMVSPAASNPRVTVEGGQVKRYVFRACFIDPYQGRVMADFAAASLGAKRAAVFTDSTSNYSRSVSEVFQSVFTANGGKIVSQEVYLQKDQNFRNQLARIQDANPDVIFIPGYYQEAGLIIKQAREMGIGVPLLGADGWDTPALIQYAGHEALNNTYFSNHYSLQNSSPINSKFVDGYRLEYCKEPGAFSALGYDTVLLVLEAIKRANSTDPEKIRDALENIEIEGATGKISFDVFHNPVKSAVVIKMVDGRQTFFQKFDP